jgi:hypothetical protein
MSYIVDFKNVSTVGLDFSPVVEALAGLVLAIQQKSILSKRKIPTTAHRLDKD